MISAVLLVCRVRWRRLSSSRGPHRPRWAAPCSTCMRVLSQPQGLRPDVQLWPWFSAAQTERLTAGQAKEAMPARAQIWASWWESNSGLLSGSSCSVLLQALRAAGRRRWPGAQEGQRIGKTVVGVGFQRLLPPSPGGLPMTISIFCSILG